MPIYEAGRSTYHPHPLFQKFIVQDYSGQSPKT
jgi:hypothetical protein